MFGMGLAVADTVAVDPMVPASWFMSPETLQAFILLVTPWIVKITTALGKDWFKTEGKYTIYLSLGLSIVLAGIGGFFSLGYLAGVGGVKGAIFAIINTVVGFLGSNGLVKGEVQAAKRIAKATVVAQQVEAPKIVAEVVNKNPLHKD